jgi:hypothetical protein
MLTMFKSRTLSIPIYRPYDEVYEFLVDPGNFPSWASNLGSDFIQTGEHEWSTTTRNGRVILRFAPRNSHGILDHQVFLEGKSPFTTPMRLIENDEGCEIIYTQFQRPGMSEEAFASEVEWVRSDFEALRSLLESSSSGEVVFSDEDDRSA